MHRRGGGSGIARGAARRPGRASVSSRPPGGRPLDERARRAATTYAAYLALGHEVLARPHATLVRQPAAPDVWDANLLLGMRGAAPGALDAALAFAEEGLAHVRHRHVIVDPDTPPALPARLALAGYRPKPTLQMLLAGPLQGPPPPEVALRPVEGDADWRSLRALLREDHRGECAREGRPLYPETVTDQILAVARAKAPALRFWLARADGRDAGFFSAWPGPPDAAGMVEDLFTLPAFRRRGIARALLHHCVADARARGAREVLIGARPDDTPKRLYAALGFEPACLTWSWVREEAGTEAGAS